MRICGALCNESISFVESMTKSLIEAFETFCGLLKSISIHLVLEILISTPVVHVSLLNQ